MEATGERSRTLGGGRELLRSGGVALKDLWSEMNGRFGIGCTG